MYGWIRYSWGTLQSAAYIQEKQGGQSHLVTLMSNGNKIVHTKTSKQNGPGTKKAHIIRSRIQA